MAELGSTGSITGDGHMIIKGRYTGKTLESLLRKYMNEYVLCAMCKDHHTKLVKDPNTRLYNVECESCGAGRAVNAIKSGFHATTRADRKAAKFAV